MMRRLTILLSVLFMVAAHAETPEQFFDQANLAYQRGKFDEAVQKYEQIVHNGIADGPLYYNLGNAYYKLGNMTMAILNYERALRFMPNDDDLRHNLQLANLMITDRIEPTPRLFVWDWWDGVKTSFSLNAITWLGYFFLVVVISSIITIILARSYALRRAGFVSATGGVMLLIISLVTFAAKLHEAQRTDSAIVTASITTIKNSPDIKSTDAFVLHAGVKVFIIDKVNDWLKIRLADGKVGWMEQKVAEII
jgi:tetratricopeptide (TPR) repeat protein